MYIECYEKKTKVKRIHSVFTKVSFMKYDIKKKYILRKKVDYLKRVSA